MKILILRNDRIGDMILSTPVFREIKKSIPNSRITVICSEKNKEIIEKNENIDEMIEQDIPDFKLKTIWRYFLLSKQIKKRKFDVGIDLRGSLLNTFFLLWLSGIKKRIGLADSHQNKISNKILNIFLNLPIKVNFFHSSRHITKDNLEFIKKGLNIKTSNNFPEIFTDEKDKKELKKLLIKNKIKKYICLFPLARLPYKQWSLEKWEKLIKNIKGDRDILLFGTKQDEKILKELSKLNKKCKILIDVNLRQLYLLVKNSYLSLAQDGGPMHLIWTSKSKSIILMSNYHPLLAYGKYFPLSNSIVLFAKKKNINLISVEKVKETINKILNRKTKDVEIINLL